jgi:predicted DNA-binding transcriptional regulator AlpA
MKPDQKRDAYPTDEVKRRWATSLPLQKEPLTPTAKAPLTPTLTAPLIPMPKAPAATGLSRPTIYRAAARGELDIRKIGRSSYLTRESVIRFIAGLPKAKIGQGGTP